VSHHILVRDELYLNNTYKWVNIPDLIPDWHIKVVLGVMMHPKNKTKPTGIAEVDPSKVIDLDNLIIHEL